jgi:integrase
MIGSIYPRPYTKDERGARRPVKGSTWTYQFMVKRNGKRVTISKGGYRTRKECEQALAAALAEYRPGTQVDVSKMTVAQYLDHYLAWVRLDKRAVTASSYEAMARLHIKPHFGDTRLAQLSPSDIGRWLTTLRDTDRRQGKGKLSSRTVQYAYAILASALAHAVDEQLLPGNPASALPRKLRPKVARRELEVWDADMLQKFLTETVDDRMHPLFVLAAVTGARRSELCGLRWDDVDFAHGQLAIRRGRVQSDRTVIEGPTKTNKPRTVALDADTIAMLRQHRTQQLQERMAWGEGRQDSGYIFTKEDGTPLRPGAVTHSFTRAVALTGLPRLTFHGLRHSHVSQLLAGGIPVNVVAGRVGHARTSMTFDTYAHVLANGQLAAAALAGELVRGSTDKWLTRGAMDPADSAPS